MSIMPNDRMLWPGGLKKCLTFSYDDGIEQDIRLLSLFKKYNVKGTFNLNPGLFGVRGTVSAGKKEVPHVILTAEDARSFYNGQEIAAHGMQHISMSGMDIARCTQEILASRTMLEKLFEHPVVGYAYAFGICDENVYMAAKNSGLRYARTIASTGTFELPQDFLRWNPTCHHNDEKLSALAKEFLSDDLYFSFISPAKLFYIWGHAYEFDQDENWDRIESFLKETSGREDVWYATNGQIEAYARAYQNLIFSAESDYVHNPSALPVWLGSAFGGDSVCVKPGQTVSLSKTII